MTLAYEFSPMSKTAEYLAAAERLRLKRLEAQAKAREESAALRQRTEETVTLGGQRGTEFLQPPIRRGERTKPIRRMDGLEWMFAKGKLGDLNQERSKAEGRLEIGTRYAAVYRATKDGTDSVPSCLSEGQGGGVTIASIAYAADLRATARTQLQEARDRLLNQPLLVRALDLVCGEGLTPREASRDGHEAGKIEALVVVALDMLASLAPASGAVRHPAT